MTADSKSRWGSGLVLVFVLFVVVMLGITGFLMTQDVNLVTDRYYDKEVQYQSRIEAMERARALGTSAGLERTSGGILLQFPRGVPRMEMAGTVTLYRPADHSADRILSVAPDSLWQQFVPTTSLAPGLWRCQMQWTMSQEEYYLEQPFMVP